MLPAIRNQEHLFSIPKFTVSNDDVKNYSVTSRDPNIIPFEFEATEEQKLIGRENAMNLIADIILDNIKNIEQQGKQFSGAVTIAVSAEINNEGIVVGGGSYPALNKKGFYLPNEIAKKLNEKIQLAKQNGELTNNYNAFNTIRFKNEEKAIITMFRMHVMMVRAFNQLGYLEEKYVLEYIEKIRQTPRPRV